MPSVAAAEWRIKMRDNAALLERAREGDKQAENILVEENMGLVWSIVRRFAGTCLQHRKAVR